MEPLHRAIQIWRWYLKRIILTGNCVVRFFRKLLLNYSVSELKDDENKIATRKNKHWPPTWKRRNHSQGPRLGNSWVRSDTGWAGMLDKVLSRHQAGSAGWQCKAWFSLVLCLILCYGGPSLHSCRCSSSFRASRAGFSQRAHASLPLDMATEKLKVMVLGGNYNGFSRTLETAIWCVSECVW